MANYETSVWVVSESTNIANNTSTLEIAIGFRRTDYPYYGWNGNGDAWWDIKVDGTEYWDYMSFDWNIPQNEWKTVHTIWVTIPHNPDGNKTISLEGQIYTGSGVAPGYMPKYSGSATLTYIPRQANIVSASNFTDETNPTINFNNPAGNAVDSLEVCISYDGSVNLNFPYRTIPSKTATSYTYELTDKQKEILRKDCTTTKSRSLYLYLRTTIGGNTLYSSKLVTMTIVNAEPTIVCSAKDINRKTLALTKDENTVIKGYSNLEISMKASAYKYASIVNNLMYFGGAWRDGTFLTWNGATSDTVDFYAKDSRGYEKNQTLKVKFVDYFKPTCSIDLGKPSADGRMSFTIKGQFYNGKFGSAGEANNVEVQYILKEDGASTAAELNKWIIVPITPSGNNINHTIYLEGLDYRKTYNIQAWVKDKLNAVYSDKVNFSTKPLFHWSKHRFNFNIPVTFNGKKMLDMVWPVGSIYTSTNATNPSKLIGGTWESFAQGRTLVGVNTNDADFRPVEHKGGEKNHTLTIAEMPTHSHAALVYTLGDGGNSIRGTNYWGDDGAHYWVPTDEKGGNQPHNNLQPYITVYFWKRTA